MFSSVSIVATKPTLSSLTVSTVQFHNLHNFTYTIVIPWLIFLIYKILSDSHNRPFRNYSCHEVNTKVMLHPTYARVWPSF